MSRAALAYLATLVLALPPSTANSWIWSPRPEYTVGWGYLPPFGLTFDWKYPYIYEEPTPPPTVPDAAEWCARRFRSYDPRSGTYLAYDGYRRRCP